MSEQKQYRKQRCSDGKMVIKIEDFNYVSIDYDYLYTDNARQHWLADQIVAILNGRPIEPTQWPEARSFDKVGGPLKNNPVLLFNQDSGIWTGWQSIGHTNSTQYSHWMPMPPKPPAPAKADWEVAWEAYSLSRGVRSQQSAIDFRAGFEAQAQKGTK